MLILGATGTAGHLAVQIAGRLGAGRIIAAGRNEQALAELPDLGADAIISLEQPREKIADAVANEVNQGGIDLILDYVWGHPTEAVIAGIMRTGLTHSASRVRLIEVGASAGPTINLPADVLRSSALEIYGSGAGSVPIEQIFDSFPEFLTLAASGVLQINVEEAPLAEVETVWQRRSTGGRRIVFTP